jgi:arabinan endo-1,5-alpha-L-arabinosidase
MKFKLSAAALLLGVAFLSASAAKEVSVHDPVMAKEGGTYYVFSTGPGITFYSSANMKDWRLEGRVFQDQPVWARRAAPSFDGHVWAPDVHFHNGQYYLYYSVSGFGKNTSGIGVTVNKTLNPRSPDYRWEDQGMVLQSVPVRDDWNAIDPNVVEDGKGGAWLVFGSFWSGLKMARLNADWSGLAEPQEWHAIASRRSNGHDDVEAPFVFKKGDYYFLFASFGLCCRKADSTYYVVVGRSKDITGPYLDKQGVDMLKGGGSTVIAGDKDWKALGHNSAYTFDGKDYMVLHAYETADDYLQKLKIMEMKWDAQGWPVVDPADLNRYRSNLLPTP